MRSSISYYCASVIALFVIIAGCTNQPRSNGSEIPQLAFDSVFQLVDTVVLEQTPDWPIVRVSGLDRNEDGYWVLSDPSEGNVRLFAPDGSLIRIIGRKGRGPREFQIPEFAQFGPTGDLHVVDTPLQRISVLRPNGEVVRTISLSDFSRVTDFHVDSNGSYWIGGFRTNGSPEVAFQLDSLGVLRTAHLPIGNFVPPGERGSVVWRSIRRPSLVARSDTIYGVLSIADVLWRVDRSTGIVTEEKVPLPDYVPPYAVSPQTVGTPAAMMRWSRSFSTTAAVHETRGMIVISFVRGVLYDGDPVTMAVRDSTGWLAVRDAPPVLRFKGDEMIALDKPGGETFVVARYRGRL